jgi:hypothetical protein
VLLSVLHCCSFVQASASKVNQRVEKAMADLMADFAAEVSQKAQQQSAQQAVNQQAEAQQHHQQHSQQQTWAQEQDKAWQKAQQQRHRHADAEPQQDSQHQHQQPPHFGRLPTEVFAVYRSHPGSKQQQVVQLLHLPAQKQEYLSALQEGLELVPISEAVNLPGAMSAEQLAMQEQLCSSKVAAAGADANQQCGTKLGSTTGPSQQHIKVRPVVVRLRVALVICATCSAPVKKASL